MDTYADDEVAWGTPSLFEMKEILRASPDSFCTTTDRRRHTALGLVTSPCTSPSPQKRDATLENCSENDQFSHVSIETISSASSEHEDCDDSLEEDLEDEPPKIVNEIPIVINSSDEEDEGDNYIHAKAEKVSFNASDAISEELRNKLVIQDASSQNDTKRCALSDSRHTDSFITAASTSPISSDYSYIPVSSTSRQLFMDDNPIDERQLHSNALTEQPDHSAVAEDSDRFNDTLEEMEMLLKYGPDYILQDKENRAETAKMPPPPPPVIVVTPARGTLYPAILLDHNAEFKQPMCTPNPKKTRRIPDPSPVMVYIKSRSTCFRRPIPAGPLKNADRKNLFRWNEELRTPTKRNAVVPVKTPTMVRSQPNKAKTLVSSHSKIPITYQKLIPQSKVLTFHNDTLDESSSQKKILAGNITVHIAD